jgi:2-polyprenyl-6-methoxyphenol hydroxylase-like FAD-dependent oxidoreductase
MPKAPPHDQPIIVAGAGPGGLVAALALHRAGFAVRLLERAPAVRAAGAGLTLQVNAMRMLGALDLLEPVASQGELLAAATVQTGDGRALSEIHMEDSRARFGAPGVAIHRGVLSQVLADALPEGILRCGAEVHAVAQDQQGVTVTLAGGEELRGSALVGADGIHSRVRAGSFPDARIRYAGYTCWRGIAPIARPLGAGTSAELWGRGRRFGIVPISATETYWFATENTVADGSDGDDVKAEMLARFSAFADPVAKLLDATPADAFLRNDIIDLQPLDRWTDGRVALMGDAAHAMTPNMGQGACQAIEDAVVLAHALADASSIPEGIAEFESLRKVRARSFVDRSWTVGRAAQWENGLARALRNAIVRMTPSSVMEKTLTEAWMVDVPRLG